MLSVTVSHNITNCANGSPLLVLCPHESILPNHGATAGASRHLWSQSACLKQGFEVPSPYMRSSTSIGIW